MSLHTVIRYFEALGRAPVELPDVIAEFRKIVISERIEVHALDVGGKALRGLHVRYKVRPHPDSALMDESIVKVIYSTQLPIEWQRLVCCKELVHVFDPRPLLTYQKKDVLRLCQDLALRNGKFHDGNDVKTTFDLLAQWQALAILFPFTLYESYLERYKSGEISLDQICGWVKLPAHFVEMIMTDQYKSIREGIID